jgi:hypothetical protein
MATLTTLSVKIRGSWCPVSYPTVALTVSVDLPTVTIMKMRMFSLVLTTGMLVVSVPALSACGSSGTTSTPPTTAATTRPAANTSSAGDPCADVINAVKAKASRPDVKSVDATGACTIVTLHSTLADTDLATAVTICEAAATVAYVGDTSSVAVDGASGRELAVGVKGEPYIGEP